MDIGHRSKIAIITGITGQDGAYLAKLLLGKGYTVHGTYRRSSTANFWRIRELGIEHHPRLRLVEHDLTDQGSAIRLLSHIRPDEVYNLAAQSFVGASFDQPTMTTQVNAVGVLNLLEAIRVVNRSIRFYQASTSEMFGKVTTSFQNEDTSFHPRSPYGVSKLYAHWITVNYRESYDIFAVSGILFNHESPLRGLEFVTRKITHGVAQIRYGKKTHLELGNLDAFRDWGYAEEYVEGMWKMLQTEQPDTYVLATGHVHSVKDFATMAFEAADMSIEWEGAGVETIARCSRSGRRLLSIDPIHYRPADVEHLSGDSTKAFQQLKWTAKTTTRELCNMMVAADLRQVA